MSRTLTNAGSVAVGLGLLVLGASPALAKEGRKDSGKHLDFLDKKLELTDAQRGQVEQILTDYHARMQSVKEQLEALRDEKHGKIKAVLTPEQQEQFEKIHRRKSHGWKRWMKGKKDQG